MIKVHKTLVTDGSGYWSKQAMQVLVTGITLGCISEDEDFAELCVHFSDKTWDCEKHGLIYTDKMFMRLLQSMLTAMGLDGTDVCYSEQGMQGDSYVSCDVEAAFIASYKAKYPEQYAAQYEVCNG
jgi:hypothetical protein